MSARFVALMMRVAMMAAFAVAVLAFLPERSVQATTEMTWAKTYRHGWAGWWTGSSVEDVLLTADGGMVVVGNFARYEGGWHVGFVLKLTADGTVQWSRLFARESTPKVGLLLYRIIQARDGGYIAVGRADFGDGTTDGVGGLDAFVVRLNADGTVRWQRVYGTPQHYEGAQDVIELSDGSLSVTGSIEGLICPGERSYRGGFLLRLTADGTPSNHYILGGHSYFIRHTVYATSDGGALTVYPTGHSDGYKLNLKKYNVQGQLVWNRAYPLASSDGSLSDARALETSDGYLVAGRASGQSLWILMKVNTSGEIQWSRRVSFDGLSGVDSLTFAADGGMLLTNANGYSRVLLKTRPTGEPEWATFYGSRRIAWFRPQGDGYVTAGDGYELLVARTDGRGFLSSACTEFNPSDYTGRVTSEPYAITPIDGAAPSGCNSAASQNWASKSVDLVFSGYDYRQTGVCQPNVTFRPEGVDFGQGRIGEESRPVEVSVSNSGGRTALTIEQVSLSDTLNFSVKQDGCTGRTIYPSNFGPSGSSSSCTLQVVFHPRRRGVQRAVLNIQGGGYQASLPLRGRLPQDIEIYGPNQVSPGQRATFVLRYHNPTEGELSDAVLVLQLPYAAEFLTGADNGLYWPERHQVVWKLGKLTPGQHGQTMVELRYRWGLPEGVEENLMAFLIAPGVGALDAAPYLAYTPVTVAAEQTLSVAEFDAVRQGAPELARRYEEAVAAGFKAGPARRLTLTDGTTLVQVVLVKPSQRQARLLWLQDGVTLEQEFSPGRYSVSTAEGGYTVSLDSGAVTLTPTASAAAAPEQAPISYQQCVVNCGLTQMALLVSGMASDTIDIVMSGRDCLACAGGDLEDCVECATAIAKATGKIGERTALGISLTAKALGCHRTCNDPAQRNKYVCQGELKTCVGREVRDWLGRRRAVVRTWSCGPNGMWQALPQFTYCDAWEVCTQTPQGARCTYCEDRLLGSRTVDRSASEDLEPSAACASHLASGGACGVRNTTVRIARDPNEKEGPVGAVQPGQELHYTIRYSNEGSGRAYGVYILDELSEYLDASTVQVGERGRYLPGTRTILWDIGELAPKGEPGSEGEVHVTVRVRADAPAGAMIINTATVYFPSVPEETRTNAVVNRVAPVAALPQTLRTRQNEAVAVRLEGRGPAGRTLTFRVAEGPQSGTLSGTAPELTYTPLAGFNGVDEFSFVVSDGTSESEAATVTVLVGSSTATPTPTSRTVYLPLVRP